LTFAEALCVLVFASGKEAEEITVGEGAEFFRPVAELGEGAETFPDLVLALAGVSAGSAGVEQGAGELAE
jgi:hypothetical protein